VGIVKREMDNPSHSYNCDVNSAWAMYNHITLALKESHPSTYMADHERLHQYFVNEYGMLVTAKVNQQDDNEDDDEAYDIQSPEPVSPGSDFDIDKENAMSQSLYGVNFL